ncbi:unnamed protein product [Penicillium salamii]|uniref:Ankyrin repeat protein n=1 Tax=Penicillium salamii TaxID=1612424 RepID=A0A9W4K0E1_9EURO|nr:unnamed protein product [Penicillium salamii]CAG8195110.1 unnamed protein product [Penicillium salamii]CAG8210913.1 unnamed protein product [Penicillium salamii]CAG8213597.1 unnamed protein product [Penicillium salamii]CAG8258002.1 unnamed protein product [Penicillium salamii]
MDWTFTNLKDKNDKSSLHYTTKTQNTHKIFKLLIQNRTNINSWDMFGFILLHKIVTKEEI